MKRTIAIVAIALSLIVAACAEPEAGSVSDSSTTTSMDTADTTTTSAAPTPTSDASTTTSTGAPQQGGNAELEELLGSLVVPGELASGRMEGVIEMTGLDASETGVEDVTLVFGAAFDSATGNSSFLMDMSSLAGAIPQDDEFSDLAADLIGTMEFRQVGDRAYMNAALFTMLFGVETPWLSMPAEEGEDFSSGFEQVPVDPSEVVDSYDGAAATVENLGEESVNGVSATHYRITFDTSAWIAELSADELAELEASGVFADGVLPMDLWISSDGYLVRLTLEIDADQAEAGSDAEFESMRVQWDMFDIGGSVTIEAPPSSEVTDVEDLEFFDFDLGFEMDS